METKPDVLQLSFRGEHIVLLLFKKGMLFSGRHSVISTSEGSGYLHSRKRTEHTITSSSVFEAYQKQIDQVEHGPDHDIDGQQDGQPC